MMNAVESDESLLSNIIVEVSWIDSLVEARAGFT